GDVADAVVAGALDGRVDEPAVGRPHPSDELLAAGGIGLGVALQPGVDGGVDRGHARLPSGLRAMAVTNVRVATTRRARPSSVAPSSRATAPAMSSSTESAMRNRLRFMAPSCGTERR